MGKIKKQRRNRTSRFNPTGVGNSIPETEENVITILPEDSDSGDLSPQGLKVVEGKLLNPVLEEKLSGLNTLAALALDDYAATIIADHKIIRKVAHLLKDPSAEIRLVAAGALRNVSAGGSDEVAELMVQQDVLSPLSDLLQTYQNAWSPSSNDLGQVSSRDDDPITNIFVHATHFLLNLCECSAEAIRVFNQEGLIHVLLRHLDPSTWGHNLSLAVAECLLCVSENNSNAQSVLLPMADSLLQYISRPTNNAVDMHFSATIAGLLMNINYCTSNGSNFQLVLQLLATILESDSVKLVSEYASQSSSTLIPQDIEHLILSQQLALEMLSNICFPDDEDEEWEDNGDTCDDEEEEEGEEAMDVGNSSFLSPEIQEGINHFKLFQLSLEKVQYPDENTCKGLQDMKLGPSFLDKLTTLQVRALLSVQNMIGVLESSDVGGSELLYSTWVNLGSMAFKKECADNIVEAATGAMRAITEKLGQDKCEKLASVPLQDIKVILEAGVSHNTGSVRANIARMVGTLGCLLVSQNSQDVLYTQHTDVLSAITAYLLKVAAHDSKLWVSAEALDVIIDLYSDDKTDKLASLTYLVDTLKEIQPNFKSKKQSKKLGDHRALVLTVKDNLLAFIKYKGPRAIKARNK